MRFLVNLASTTGAEQHPRVFDRIRRQASE
jgi:hypothetical protein